MHQISVVLPVKNGESYIADSISYLKNNILSNDEVVIVNDGSVDASLDLLIEYTAGDSRFHILNNPKSGLVEALNFGVSQSQNDWIARFDIDDIYISSRISEQRKLISDEVVGIFCDYQMFSSRVANLGVFPCAIDSESIGLSLTHSVRTPHPGVLFSKLAFNSVGGYRLNDYPAEDLSLWMRLYQVGKLTGVPKILFYYRRTIGSITSTNNRNMRQKKQDLVRDFIQNKYEPEKILNHYRQVFNSYHKTPYGSLRQILFMYDLVAYLIYRRFYSKLVEIVFFVAVRFILNPRLFFVLGCMAGFRLKRRLFL